jgi:hypothetical protein
VTLEFLFGMKKDLVIIVTKRIIFRHSPPRLGYWNQSEPKSFFLRPQVIDYMVARDGIEPPTPAFSGLRSTD